MRKYIALFLVIGLASCSWMPFVGTSDKDAAQKKSDAATKTADKQKGEKIQEAALKPGDIKVIDGVEYIYARNRKYMLTPYEPENVWIRKDLYSPGMFDGLTAGQSADPKEQKELEARIAKLEEDLKKKGIQPQMAYPAQVVYMPGGGMGYASGVPMLGFNYPSPKMKRRVVVLPFADQTNYKTEDLADLATKRLISRIENSNAIICVDPNTIPLQWEFTAPQNMKLLNEASGVQALMRGTLSDVYTTTSRIEGKEDKEMSFALSKLSVEILNTETDSLLKKLSGRNPVFLSREKGDMSSEKAKIKAIDLAIELIADDILKTILSLDWHARVVSTETNRVFVNAGRLSGLQVGDILEVYAPGQQVIDTTTNRALGKVRGDYKGEIEVGELFGVDASWAKVLKGNAFSVTDLVYIKK
jgi:hypothetical protein